MHLSLWQSCAARSISLFPSLCTARIRSNSCLVCLKNSFSLPTGHWPAHDVRHVAHQVCRQLHYRLDAWRFINKVLHSLRFFAPVSTHHSPGKFVSAGLHSIPTHIRLRKGRRSHACAERTNGLGQQEKDECNYGSGGQLPGSTQLNENDQRCHQEPEYLPPFRVCSLKIATLKHSICFAHC